MGCPVATVGINNSANAAQLAARILAISDLDVQKKLESYLETQTKSVEEKADKLQEMGHEKYLSSK